MPILAMPPSSEPIGDVWLHIKTIVFEAESEAFRQRWRDVESQASLALGLNYTAPEALPEKRKQVMHLVLCAMVPDTHPLSPTIVPLWEKIARKPEASSACKK